MPEVERSQQARAASEAALVRIVHHYGARPEFVVLGGLLPGFAAKDPVVQQLSARIGDRLLSVEVNTSGLAGFLLAKSAAAHGRHLQKDWYDIAFVLLYNDLGGPRIAADVVRERFGGALVGPVRTALNDLRANFSEPSHQGPTAFVRQMLVDHPEADPATLAADAVVAVAEFHSRLFASPR